MSLALTFIMGSISQMYIRLNSFNSLFFSLRGLILCLLYNKFIFFTQMYDFKIRSMHVPLQGFAFRCSFQGISWSIECFWIKPKFSILESEAICERSPIYTLSWFMSVYGILYVCAIVRTCACRNRSLIIPCVDNTHFTILGENDDYLPFVVLFITTPTIRCSNQIPCSDNLRFVSIVVIFIFAATAKTCKTK